MTPIERVVGVDGVSLPKLTKKQRTAQDLKIWIIRSWDDSCDNAIKTHKALARFMDEGMGDQLIGRDGTAIGCERSPKYFATCLGVSERTVQYMVERGRLMLAVSDKSAARIVRNLSETAVRPILPLTRAGYVQDVPKVLDRAKDLARVREDKRAEDTANFMGGEPRPRKDPKITEAVVRQAVAEVLPGYALSLEQQRKAKVNSMFAATNRVECSLCHGKGWTYRVDNEGRPAAPK